MKTLMSPLAMAEWIEILIIASNQKRPGMSPLAMAEWIEIQGRAVSPALSMGSPLAMAEWIEICACLSKVWRIFCLR